MTSFLSSPSLFFYPLAIPSFTRVSLGRSLSSAIPPSPSLPLLLCSLAAANKTTVKVKKHPQNNACAVQQSSSSRTSVRVCSSEGQREINGFKQEQRKLHAAKREGPARDDREGRRPAERRRSDTSSSGATCLMGSRCGGKMRGVQGQTEETRADMFSVAATDVT